MKRIALAASCVALLPPVASAAQWTIVPQVALGADADSNRRLQREPRESESAVLGATLAIARATEVSTLAVLPRVSISRYSGEDALDSEDWGVNALWRHNGERFVFDVQAGVSDDSTLVTELGETGFVQGNTRRRSDTLSASLSQVVSARHLLRYQLGTSQIDYQQTAGTGLVGYEYPNASLTYVFTATQRLDTTISLNSARLDAPDIDLRSDTDGAQVGVRYRLSQRFDLEARVGQSSTTSGGRSDHEQSFFGALSWEDELNRLELSVSRDVSPSGRGVLENADELRVSLTRQLRERLSLDVTARASRRENLDGAIVRNDYEYQAITCALALRLDESWNVKLGGLYNRQDYERAPAADGRRIGLSIEWRPAK